MPNDPIQAIEFAQSKGQARKDGRTGVLFADVAGCDEALRKLGYVVEARPLTLSCPPYPARPPSSHSQPCRCPRLPDAPTDTSE